jgi:hypothetical protein
MADIVRRLVVVEQLPCRQCYGTCTRRMSIKAAEPVQTLEKYTPRADAPPCIMKFLGTTPFAWRLFGLFLY